MTSLRSRTLQGQLHTRGSSLTPRLCSAARLPCCQTAAALQHQHRCSTVGTSADAQYMHSIQDHQCASSRSNQQQTTPVQAAWYMHALLAACQLHLSGAACAAEAATQGLAEGQPITPVDLAHFQPGPMNIGWQIWVGAAAGVIPFAIGAYEFGKRILIQQRCQVCAGKGLVASSKGQGRLRKCPQCGGFFPWVSWRLFLTSAASPGNGGPLLQPKGQTSVFYKVPPPPQAQQPQQQRQQQTVPADSPGEHEHGTAGDETPENASANRQEQINQPAAATHSKANQD